MKFEVESLRALRNVCSLKLPPVDEMRALTNRVEALETVVADIEHRRMVDAITGAGR